MNANAVLPLCSSLLSAVFFVFVADQWRQRRRPYQLIWAIGMLWYALAPGTEFLGGAFGWSEPLYRAWYLIGAVWVAGWLGLGTSTCSAARGSATRSPSRSCSRGCSRTSPGASTPTPTAALRRICTSPWALVLALLIAVETWRGSHRWPHIAGARDRRGQRAVAGDGRHRPDRRARVTRSTPRRASRRATCSRATCGC